MWEDEFIKKYNQQIERMKKAETYFENKSIEDEGKIKFLPEYNKIVQNLSLLQIKYKEKFKKEMEVEEKLFGFKC